MPMQPDEDKVDDAVWAALFHARPQRSGMERVRLVRPESAARQGDDPKSGRQSQIGCPTEEGVAESYRLFRELFAKAI